MGITNHYTRPIAKPYVAEDGIYVPLESNPQYSKMLIPRELFVEAYNKYIKGEEDKNND
jgi:hypothetical protein